MAHGEAEPGRADGESRVREPDVALPGRALPRRACHEAAREPAPELARDEATAEESATGRPPACRSERPGWAGAHRHGAVRPRRRTSRRERPPDRWC
ncbi:MAG TPA: hypothetical protein VI011_13330 [Asanoa sp.]